MRELLDLCVQMDELAHDTYVGLSEACDDPALAETFRVLAAEELSHVGWWRDLEKAYEGGLLPDIWSDTDDVRVELRAMLDGMKAGLPQAGKTVCAEEALATAVNIEFFALDPVFGELLDLAEPAVAAKRHEAYARHIDRLVEAVEKHYPTGTLSGFLARVLRRSWRENRRLATHAMRDPLTGLSNRRAFSAHLNQWIAWSARYGHPLSVILLDLDYFKQVNDEHGHAAGDLVLHAVGQAIGRATRASDMIARYGGDEFVVLAPETGPDDARVLGDRIVDAIRNVRALTSKGAVITPTASLGIAIMVDPPNAEPRSPDDLLAAADQGLYAAKRAGRDRVADPMLLASAL